MCKARASCKIYLCIMTQTGSLQKVLLLLTGIVIAGVCLYLIF
jgi:hypothetical protein